MEEVSSHKVQVLQRNERSGRVKYTEKTLKPRLPKGVTEKLQKGSGGGRHKDKKNDYKRQAKHRLKGVL